MSNTSRRTCRPRADGGFVVAGNIYPYKHVPGVHRCPDSKGWLAKFDSLGTLQSEQRITGRNLAISPSAQFTHVQPSANGQYWCIIGARVGSTQYVLDLTWLPTPPPRRVPPRCGKCTCRTTTPQALNPFDQQTALQADGSMILAGRRNIPHVVGEITEGGPGLGLLTLLCQAWARRSCLTTASTLPTPTQATPSTPAATRLTLVDFSACGPRFAFERGAGTSPTCAATRAKPRPRPLRHRAAAGAAVTLTISNNLGCSATQTLYPFGTPTASQQARARLPRWACFPTLRTTRHAGCAAARSGKPLT